MENKKVVELVKFKPQVRKHVNSEILIDELVKTLDNRAFTLENRFYNDYKNRMLLRLQNMANRRPTAHKSFPINLECYGSSSKGLVRVANASSFAYIDGIKIFKALAKYFRKIGFDAKATLEKSKHDTTTHYTIKLTVRGIRK